MRSLFKIKFNKNQLFSGTIHLFFALSVIAGFSQSFCFSKELEKDFNIFTHRKLLIGKFENEGEPAYNFLAESICSSLYSSAISIPYLTLTNEEKSFLESLSVKPEYKEKYLEAKKQIGYIIDVSVDRGEPPEGSFALYISGSFKPLPEEKIFLSIKVNNYITGKTEQVHEQILSVEETLTKPYLYTIPFFKKLLKYSTCTAGFRIIPEDSLVFIDGKYYSTGTRENILLPRGRHRITVERDGYRTFSELIYIEEDGYFREINLKKIESERILLLNTKPMGISVYLDEKFHGKTPLFIYPGPEEKTITLLEKDYTPVTVNLNEIESYIKTIEFELKTTDETELNHLNAEKHKKKARLFSYLGIGFLGTAVLFGTQATLYQQKADLYQSLDTGKYTSALNTAKVLQILTVSSSAVSCSLFTYSFREILCYFRGYSPQQIQKK